MKKITLVCVLVVSYSFSFGQLNGFDAFFNRSDAFFAEHVSNGKVAYQNIVNAPAELDSLTDFIATANYDSEALNTKKAFLINAYNLLVINQIVTNYPVMSPMDIEGFFKGTEHTVGGEEITLNHLENNILREKYPDPRYHFSLVCGAVDCPPLGSSAMRPETLDDQLNALTTTALNNDSFVFEMEGIVNLSQIFQWYAEDFGSDKDSILAYINGYRIDAFVSEKVSYYPYDWTLNAPGLGTSQEVNSPANSPINLQTFTAGSLLRRGQMDFTLFNTIYTHTKSNWLGVDYSGFRETFATSLIQFTIGVDKKKRINLGIDLNLKASAYSVDSTFRSVGRPFAFRNTDTSRVGLTSIGLRGKFAPFAAVKDLSIQTTVYIPTIKNPEGSSDPNQILYWADWDRLTMWNQIFYTKTWNKFQLFLELDALFRFKYRANQISHVDAPVTVIGSYFPTSKLTLYGIASHNARFTYNIGQVDTDWVIPSVYTSVGGGVKYQLMSNFTVEFLYTNFVYGVNSGLGSTFNLGFKYLTK